jgi:hypothetical protein
MIDWISITSAVLLLSTAEADSRARLDSLAEATGASISRFSDRSAAIAAGYRRIGTDFPSMGEHWLSTAALLSRRLDPARPTILAYANINGVPQLIGAGFVVTTTGADNSDAPGWPSFWHEHSGALADESGAHAGARDTTHTATHVWVLHIWTSLPNPLGRYDADNWALPFARAGMEIPANLDHDMGRAVSLTVAGGDDYLRRVLTSATLRTDGNATQVDAAIASARSATHAILARAVNSTLAADETEALRDVWRHLGDELRAVIGAAVDPLLAPPHRHHGEMPEP